MRELDQRSHEQLQQIDKEQKEYLSALRLAARENADEPSEEEMQQIRGKYQKCLEYADERVAIAVQTYELVDKHIRRLDSDLKKFEIELEAAGTPAPAGATPVAADPLPSHKKERDRSRKEKAHEQPPAPAVKPKKQKTEIGIPIGIPEARLLHVDLDMPIDPNEPTYCICNRVSFGEMVGCDNADCKIEWFHFECVGLTAPPKGKWYCPECTAQMRHKFRR